MFQDFLCVRLAAHVSCWSRFGLVFAKCLHMYDTHAIRKRKRACGAIQLQILKVAQINPHTGSQPHDNFR